MLTTISYIKKSIPLKTELLAADLEAVGNWSSTWQLELSPPKCFVLSISVSDTIVFDYRIANQPITRVNEVRDLGVIVDGTLSFGAHIDKICKQANRTASLLFRVFSSRDTEFLVSMFRTYVRSKLEYASEEWCPNQVSLVRALEKVQSRFTKRLLAVSGLLIIMNALTFAS